jgi:cobalamin biosynthesis Co2+ chelatase CbiK
MGLNLRQAWSAESEHTRGPTVSKKNPIFANTTRRNFRVSRFVNTDSLSADTETNKEIADKLMEKNNLANKYEPQNYTSEYIKSEIKKEDKNISDNENKLISDILNHTNNKEYVNSLIKIHKYNEIIKDFNELIQKTKRYNHSNTHSSITRDSVTLSEDYQKIIFSLKKKIRELKALLTQAFKQHKEFINSL